MYKKSRVQKYIPYALQEPFALRIL